MDTTTETRPVLNAKLLREIANQIEKRPEGWDQSDWIDINGEFLNERKLINKNKMTAELEKCGTRCCIAGYAFALSSRHKKKEAVKSAHVQYIPNIAQHLLGLTKGERLYLFMTDWGKGLTIPQVVETLRKYADQGYVLENRGL